MGTFLGVPMLRIIVFWSLYWCPPTLGNYNMAVEALGVLSQDSAKMRNNAVRVF